MEFGLTNGKDWTWRKQRQIEHDISTNPSGIFVAEIDGTAIRRYGPARFGILLRAEYPDGETRRVKHHGKLGKIVERPAFCGAVLGAGHHRDHTCGGL